MWGHFIIRDGILQQPPFESALSNRKRGPRASPTNRVARGKEPQRNERTAAFEKKPPQAICSLRRCGGGGWIRPPAGGPFRGSGLPPAGHSLPLPFESALEQKNRPRLSAGPIFFGGGGWIRTTVGIASRFTVCPLWPLGNSSIFSFSGPCPSSSPFALTLRPCPSTKSKPSEAGSIWRGGAAEGTSFPACGEASDPQLVPTMELVDGLEPPTC